MSAQQYIKRKNGASVTAIQLTADNWQAVKNFLKESGSKSTKTTETDVNGNEFVALNVRTFRGDERLQEGGYAIKHSKGHVFVAAQNDFEARFGLPGETASKGLGAELDPDEEDTGEVEEPADG